MGIFKVKRVGYKVKSYKTGKIFKSRSGKVKVFRTKASASKAGGRRVRRY